MDKKWWKREWIQKWFQRDNLIILVLSGILLFIIALPVENGEKKGEKAPVVEKELSSQTESNKNMEEGEKTLVAEEEREYVGYLEKRLEKMLAGVDGVGQVAVMITLESSEELVLEKDEPVSQSSVEEQDSQGGNRTTSQLEKKETTVYSTEGTYSEPYVVKRLFPKVEGVLVVAQGAGNGSVNKSITEIIQALFGVEAHKVKVVPMGVE